MVAVPGATPVTTPVLASTDAMAGAELDHVPMPEPSKYRTTTIPEPPVPPELLLL